MSRERIVYLFGVAVAIVLAGLGVGSLWWYLFGPNQIDSAELVPGNAIAFVTIPNGATVVEGFAGSQAKSVLDSPNMKPLQDYLVSMVGQKNVDLFHAFLPNLSGQSFIAVTHFDYDHPEQVGLIAAMKPKAGLGDFGTFLMKLKEAYPDQIKQGKTGNGTVSGVDYEWIQGPGAADKICVAQIKGWIVTSWGEAPLQDWIERFHKTATTSSLAEDVDYRTSVSRVGENPTTLVYVNYHALVGILQKSMAKTNPATGDFLAKKLDALGGGAIATRFENGEIVDRFSLLVPRPVQLDAGVAADPCAYETLKFTGPDTHLYWASSINWKNYFNNIKAQTGTGGTTEVVNPTASSLYTYVQNWIHNMNLDAKKNIIDALGSEFSVQVDWSQDTTWPEAGLFVKIDKPADFKPTIDALVETVRKYYLQSATVKELNANGHNFAALKFIDPGIFTPTITEDGDYLGVFLTENQAVRAFSRDESLGMTHNANFNRQTGSLRNGSAQVIFLDSPYILDRAYKTALPFLPFAMSNKDVAALLKDKEMPQDLSWLAPIGTWACVITPDGAGIQATSMSGIGNQGILLGSAMYQATGLLQSMGYLPKPPAPTAETPVTPAPAPAVTPVAAAPSAPASISAAPLPPPAATTNADSTPVAPPAASTNASSDVLAPPAETNAPSH